MAPVRLFVCFPWLWEPLTFEPKFDLDYILEQALRWHASTINIR